MLTDDEFDQKYARLRELAQIDPMPTSPEGREMLGLVRACERYSAAKYKEMADRLTPIREQIKVAKAAFCDKHQLSTAACLEGRLTDDEFEQLAAEVAARRQGTDGSGKIIEPIYCYGIPFFRGTRFEINRKTSMVI